MTNNEHTEQSERAELRSALARVTQQLKDGDTLGASLALSEVEKLIDALLSANKVGGESEPAMIYHGRCVIDCGEHGHQDVELLKLIPKGTKLYTCPQPQPVPDDVVKDALLDRAREWIDKAPHGDNCFVSDHYEGDPGNRCNCGKDGFLAAIDAAMLKEKK